MDVTIDWHHAQAGIELKGLPHYDRRTDLIGAALVHDHSLASAGHGGPAIELLVPSKSYVYVSLPCVPYFLSRLLVEGFMYSCCNLETKQATSSHT